MSLSGPVLVDNPRENPPGKLPPEPEPEGSLLTRAALWAVNSKVGLALSPVATTGPANAMVVTTVLTAAAQLLMSASLFNPNWSPPGTWNSTGDGSIPDKDVTQKAHGMFNLTTIGITVAFVVAGGILGPIAGGLVDELRGTKEKGEKKAKAGEMSTNINKLIAEQSLLENVTQKAQDSLHDQVLEVESLIGITWNTMEMLEKIQKLRPAIDSASGASSRRSSVFSQTSSNGSIRQRQQLNRPGRLSSNSSMHSARE